MVIFQGAAAVIAVASWVFVNRHNFLFHNQAQKESEHEFYIYCSFIILIMPHRIICV